MKMNALSYMIKYLPSLLVNFQAAIYKILLLARCRAFFEHVEPTTIYIIKNISTHYRKLAPLHRIFLILTSTLLLKASDEL